jgi:hypothetical protein
VSLTAYTWEGVTQGAAQEYALPAGHTAVGLVGAHGHAFLTTWTGLGVFVRMSLQEVTTSGPVGAPLAVEGTLGQPSEVGMVSTSLGGLLYVTNGSGIPGVGLRVAALRLCDGG